MRDDLVALFTVCFIKQSGTIVVGYYVAVNVAEVFFLWLWVVYWYRFGRSSGVGRMEFVNHKHSSLD